MVYVHDSQQASRILAVWPETPGKGTPWGSESMREILERFVEHDLQFSPGNKIRAAHAQNRTKEP